METEIDQQLLGHTETNPTFPNIENKKHKTTPLPENQNNQNLKQDFEERSIYESFASCQNSTGCNIVFNVLAREDLNKVNQFETPVNKCFKYDN